MRKFILPLLLFLGSISPAFGGYTERTNCADLNPTVADAHKITCKQTTTTGGRAAGHLFNWNGAAWVDIDTDVVGGSDDDQTASEVPFAPAGSISSTNVQDAIEELEASIGFTGDAGDVTVTPAGNIASTNVQAALEELDTEKASTSHTQAATTVTVAPAGLISSTNVQTALQELDTEKSATSHNHDGTYKPIADDAADLSYTPADGTDWGTDPNDVAEGLDQLAERLTTVEVTGLDADLTALAGNSTDGFWAHTGAGTGAARTLQDVSNVLTWTNPAGVAGNPAPVFTDTFYYRSLFSCADAGSSDAYACTPTIAPTAYRTGGSYRIFTNTSNTGPASVNLASIGAVAIKKYESGSKVDPATGDICANAPLDLVYDGTHMIIQSKLCVPGGSGSISGLTAGTIPKAADATSIEDSSIVEDADSVNFAKPIEVNCAGATCFFGMDTTIFDTTLKTWDYPANASSTFVGDDTSQTLTNKTISATSNTLSGLPVSKDISILLPTTGDTNKAQMQFFAAATLTKVSCSTLGASSTATIQLDKRAEATPNTAGTDALTSTLVCDTDRQSTTSFSSAAVAANQVLNLQITATANAPEVVRIHVHARLD
jgi:hypothetical protein